MLKKKNNKNKLILMILIIVILVLGDVSVKHIFLPQYKRAQFAKQMITIADSNEKSIFKIAKIIKYSSAEAIDKSPEQNLQDLSIHQYSDIAIYIDNGSSNLTEENTIKELYLDNFKIDLKYELRNTCFILQES